MSIYNCTVGEGPEGMAEGGGAFTVPIWSGSRSVLLPKVLHLLGA